MNTIDNRETPIISFAIPTYNFGPFIAETVDSIQRGATRLTSSQFEIVILDGGSTDNTTEVVEQLQHVYSNIRYIRQHERGGIDRDLNTVSEYAEGSYIWFFSADDLLVPGWDAIILPSLQRNNDIYLVPATLCDINMQPLRDNPIFNDCTDSDPIDFRFSSAPSALDAYLRRIRTLEAMFSFMSAVVVRRDVWLGLPVREDYFGSCWGHCARLMPLFFRDTRLTYINRYLINKRAGNDSFLEHGFVNRVGIAVEGWSRIISEFFTDEAQRRLLFDALRKDMPLTLFVYAKISAKNPGERDRLMRMLNTLYGDLQLTAFNAFLFRLARLTPSSPLISNLLQPLLPLIIRLRHRLRSAFT